MATVMPPRLTPGERLRRAGIAAWSIIGLLILAVVSFWGLTKISVIFPPMVLALLIIYLLNPIVSRLERRGIRRGFGAVIAYLLASGVVGLVVIVSGPFVGRQVSELAEDAPRFRRELADTVDNAAGWVEDRLGTNIETNQIHCLLVPDDDPDLQSGNAPQNCSEVTREIRDRIGGSIGRLTEIGLDVLSVLLVFILAPLIALYLLIDLPQLQRDLLNLVPETNREEFADVGSRVGQAVGGFFRGQLFVALVVGVLSAIGFRLIDLPFWLVIGAIAGFFNLIPLVGPWVGGAIGFIVGTVTEGVGLGIQAAVVELIVQQLDNHIISPNVMKRTVNIHPVTVMLSLLAGGALAGFWGVLLAVPAVAVVKIVVGHLWTTRILGRDTSPIVEEAATAVVSDDVPEDVIEGPEEEEEHEEEEEKPAPKS